MNTIKNDKPKKTQQVMSNPLKNTQVKKVKLPTKLERALHHFATGKSLNRFEAEKVVNDHCLHSTMSTIKNQHNITYQTITETVPGWNNTPTKVSRYWLAEADQIKAWKLIHHMQARRGVIKQEVATC